MSSSALPLFCVQHPLQSVSAHSSSTVTTMVFDPDLRHRSWRASAGMPFEALLRFGNTETMLCFWTQACVSVWGQAANMPSYWQPLYWMHSALPGAGYEVKFVLLAVCQVRPGLEQS